MGGALSEAALIPILRERRLDERPGDVLEEQRAGRPGLLLRPIIFQGLPQAVPGLGFLPGRQGGLGELDQSAVLEAGRHCGFGIPDLGIGHGVPGYAEGLLVLSEMQG